MPTYRYRCTKCDDEFEVWQSITDDQFARHDAPCKGKLVKVLSPAGIVLKGSGFYKTDNRGKTRGSRNEPKESGSAAAKDSSSSSSSPASSSASSSSSGGDSSTGSS